MADQILMPKATAVWLVENTSLTFEQIADFCGGKDGVLVLEEQDDGGRAVAAWRWHGWGFSLLWRGAPDR